MTRRRWVLILVGCAVVVALVMVLRGERRDVWRAPAVRGAGTGTPIGGASADPGPSDRSPRGDSGGADRTRGEEHVDLPARLLGTVRLRGSGVVVATGTVEIQFVEHGTEDQDDAEGEPADIASQVGQEVPIDERGGYDARLPSRALVVGIRIEPPNGEALATFRRTDVPLAPFFLEGERRLDLEADRGYEVVGIVVDALSGEPVPGALISELRDFGGNAGTRSDPSGNFHLTGAEDVDGERTLELRAEHETHLPRRFVVRFPIDAAAVQDVRIGMLRGVVVAGQVLKNGCPVRARLLLSAPAPEASDWGRAQAALAHTTSSEDGRFQFPPIPPVHEAHLVVPPRETPGGGAGAGAVRDILDLREDRRDLVIDIGAAVRFRVRARYPEGEFAPPSLMRVLFTGLDGTTWLSWMHDGKDQGGWYFRGAPGCEYKLSVFAGRGQGDAEEHFEGTGVALAGFDRSAGWGDWSSAGTWEVVVPLRSPSPVRIPVLPKTVHGVGHNAVSFAQHVWLLRVVDELTGAPLSGVVCSIQEPGSGGGSSVLDDSGRLLFGAALGRSHLRLRCRGYEDRLVVVEPTRPGFAEVTARLRPLE